MSKLSLMVLLILVVTLSSASLLQAAPATECFEVSEYCTCRSIIYGFYSKPLNKTSEFTLADKAVYFWLRLTKITGKMRISVVVDPPGMLPYEVIQFETPEISDELKQSAMIWAILCLKLPIREPIASVDFRESFLFHLNKTVPVPWRRMVTGVWKIIVNVNGVNVTASFKIRKIRVKVKIFDINRHPLSNVTLLVDGFQRYAVYKSNEVVLEVDPGFHMFEVIWNNKVKVACVDALIRADSEIVLISNVTDFTITVLSAKNEPLSGAEVMLSLDLGDNLLYVIKPLKTNASGTVSIARIPITPCLVKVKWRGLTILEKRIELTGGRLVLRLPVYNLVVQVIGEQGQGIEGALVKIRQLNLTSRTDAQGKVVFEHIPAGRWLVEVSYKNLNEFKYVQVSRDTVAVVQLKVFIEIFGFTMSRDTFILIITGVFAMLLMTIVLVYVSLVSSGKEYPTRRRRVLEEV